ncbi:MAG: S-methyl-5-thioribose-1-phosphate isomerase [Gemmatimonadota bacterium]|nr:S-methyl-5-thioribose-1-phosphate isomerase [Gemmatimonadota bacterium]
MDKAKSIGRKKPVRTICWLGEVPHGTVRLIDQTLLPGEEIFLERADYRLLAADIRRLAVRGAPAIGVAGAFGIVLGLQEAADEPPEKFRAAINKPADLLAGTRPTAVNLFWAIERMRKHLSSLDPDLGTLELLAAMQAEAVEICEEDRRLCQAMGEHGAPLIEEGMRVLTHCNAGALATAGIGTALAPVYVAHEQGKAPKVFADETRPLLQGARLTAWELARAGIEVTLICDNMAGSLMRSGQVDLVITGADRVAANGDAANKIGTYSLAVLAHRHRIPFYIAAPFSTFDLSLADGGRIPIEERARSEVTEPCGLKKIAPEAIKVFNPAFDVTPAELIAGFITDKGIIRPLYTENIAGVLGVK